MLQCLLDTDASVTDVPLTNYMATEFPDSLNALSSRASNWEHIDEIEVVCHRLMTWEIIDSL